MKHLMLLERRLQDLERRAENQNRAGEVVDVKFDKEKKRWYVKINDGPDLKPSSGDAPLGDEETFKSDWIPWKSFAHGTIKTSFPPRKGMKASAVSPNGDSELAYGEAYHYDPKSPSPHDKEDEIAWEIEEPEQEGGQQQGGQQGAQQQSGQQRKKIRFQADNNSITITSGEMTFIVSANEIKGKIGDAEFSIKKDEIVAKKGEANVSLKEDAIRATHGGGKAVVKKNGAKIEGGSKYIVASAEGLFSKEPIVVGPDTIGD